MKKIIYFLTAVLFLFSLYGCEKMTPPIAWPQETPTLENELPINEVQEPSDTGGGDSGTVNAPGEQPSDSETEPPIKADPAIIYTADYTNGYIGEGVVSTIKVSTGVFEPNAPVDIWATAIGRDIVSPPFIWANDLDDQKENIQGMSWPDGGLEFRIVAGYSAGLYIIYVSDGKKTLSTSLSIVKP